MNLFQDIEAHCEKGPRSGSTRIIAIDGRAGSGKTTLAGDLKLHLSLRHQVKILHLDEIYDGWKDALGEHLTSSLTGILRSLERHEPILLQIYNWKLGKFDSERQIDPPELLVIEGVGSGQRAIRSAAAATIWMDISAEVGLSRVLERDGTSISAQMIRWQVAEEAHFLNDETRENADFILTSE